MLSYLPVLSLDTLPDGLETRPLLSALRIRFLEVN